MISPVLVPQGDLAGPQPDRLPPRVCLGLLVIQLGTARAHDQLVVGAVDLGLVPPAHLVVGLADDLLGRGHPGVGGEKAVAAAQDRVPVLPEDPDGYRVQHQLEHAAGLPQRGLRPDAFGDVLIHAQDSHHPAGAVGQGHLGGVDPKPGAIRLLDRLDNVAPGLPGGDHFAVARDVRRGVIPRHRQVKIRLADHIARAVKSQGAGKRLVAPQVDAVPILPEDGLGNGVDDLPQGGALLLELLLHNLFAAGILLEPGDPPLQGLDLHGQLFRKQLFFRRHG